MSLNFAQSFRTIVLLCLLLQLLGMPAHAAAGAELQATAHQDHLWFIAQSTTASKSPFLCHSALSMGGAYFSSQASLTQQPLAIASWQNQVWMVFANRGGAANSQREVFTIRVIPDQTLGGFTSVPKDRLDIVSPLPDGGRLAGFIANATGPIALLLPDASQQATRLVQLRAEGGGSWTDLPLPPEFPATAHAILAMQGSQGDDLVILARGGTSDAPHHNLRFDRNAQGDWTTAPIELDLNLVRTVTNVAGQMVAVVASASAQAPPMFDVMYLRPGNVIPLTSLSPPDGDWAIVGMSNGLRLLERKNDNRFHIRSIDPLTGEATKPQVMAVQPISSAKIWQMVVLIAAIAAGLLLVFLVRPTPKDAIKLPTGVAFLPAGRRFFALLIDLAPAGFATMILLKTRLPELFMMPLLTANLEQSTPYLLMVAFTIAHTTIAELFTAKSLGKSVMGARIVRLDGSAPTKSQILLRSTLKLVVLLVPPLAALALLNPHVQGVDDMAAGTVVVHEPETE